MGNSTSYLAIETMIQKGWFWMQFDRFEKLLDLLEKRELITAREHQDLLALARKMNLDKLSR